MTTYKVTRITAKNSTLKITDKVSANFPVGSWAVVDENNKVSHTKGFFNVFNSKYAAEAEANYLNSQAA
jgi:hypothetical protein